MVFVRKRCYRKTSLAAKLHLDGKNAFAAAFAFALTTDEIIILSIYFLNEQKIKIKLIIFIGKITDYI